MRAHCLLVIVVLLCLSASASALVLHVAPQGDDAHDGSVDRPVATLQRAVDLAAEQPDDCTIVVHAGVYHGPVRLARPGQDHPLRRLTIAAATDKQGAFQEAVLDGSYAVTEARPVDGMPGLFAFVMPGYSSASIKPQMWELDTRVRYSYAADLRGVAARPAAFFHDADQETIFFHTSDGRPPAEHQIGLLRTGVHSATRLWIQRPHVTVRGLTFRHGADLTVDADDVQIEDCRTRNATRAVLITPQAADARVLRHHGVDLANGVMSHGRNARVEHCTFLRPLDRFTIPLNTQDQSGIQFYAPAVGGVARGNLVAGFHLGLFMKGVKGTFTIEANTAVGPGPAEINGYGILHVDGWRAGDVCRRNVVAGFYMPAATFQRFEPGFVHEANLFHEGSDISELLQQYRAAGTGQGDRVADPRFVDRAGGDYRLAYTSPMVRQGEAQAGALPAAPAEVAVVEPASPSVTTAVSHAAPQLVGEPRVRSGAHGFHLQFTTTVPCAVNVHWGRDETCGHRVDGPRHVERRYDSNVGNEFTLIDEPLRRTRHHATVVIERMPAQTPLSYRLELIDAAGTSRLTEPRSLRLGGAGAVWHVSPQGDDDSQHGPLRTIQEAVDRALPGDRIVLADGLYGRPVVIRHGGVAGAPLVIEAEHEHQALIDTDQDPAIHAAFQIERASHVVLRGIEFRWFHAYAIYAHEAQHLDIERCKFWNMHFTKGRRSGVGLFATRGSDLRIDHCLFFNLNAAFDILRTRGYVITHNTAMRLTHRVALFSNSAPGLLRHNSFTFTGNYHYHLSLSPQQLEQFDSDYNNLAQYVHISYARKDDPTPQELAEMLDPSGDDPSLYPWGNKGIATVSGRPAATVPFFSRWQSRYGKDRHSIFAHPRYVDPRRHDFRLLPDSPNIGAGEGGATIGAGAVAAPTP